MPFDATVKVDDGTIGVHKVVLSARCEFFQRCFEDGTEVVLPGRMANVRTFLRFLYATRLPGAEQLECLAVELPLLAAQCGVEVMDEPCVRFAQFAITVENVVDVFLRAVQFKCAYLISFCRPIIIGNRWSLEPAAWKKLEKNGPALLRLLQVETGKGGCYGALGL